MTNVSFKAEDEIFMRAALQQAQLAAQQNEVPVGAVIVCGNEIIASAHNTCEAQNMQTRHAELAAIEAAAQTLGSWRLDNCTLYVTLEPCAMCAGAAINSRVNRVVFGAYDERAGCAGSLINLFAINKLRTTAITGGVLAQECEAQLSSFFKKRRSDENI